MLKSTSFAVHVTYTCPLTCAHCCYSSGPRVTDRLEVSAIMRTIQELDTESIRLVAFTGGEPFLLGKDLNALVKCASNRGFVTRVVTSAYWAKTVTNAERLLIPLRDSGLDQISISWDDFHEAQKTANVTIDHVRNAFLTAKKLGISPAVNIVQAKDSNWTAEKVKHALGLPDDSEEVVAETPLNLTGRAGEELVDAGFRPARVIGPCPYVLTGPTLSAKGKLLACCGVIEHTGELVLDDSFLPENVNEAITDGLSSPLLNWLFLRGPYHIIEQLGKRYDLDVPSMNEVGGNCEACRILFHTPKYRDKLDDLVAERVDSISGELILMDALGLLEPGDNTAMLDLWRDRVIV